MNYEETFRSPQKPAGSCEASDCLIRGIVGFNTAVPLQEQQTCVLVFQLSRDPRFREGPIALDSFFRATQQRGDL